MVAEILEPTVQELQKDVIELLEQVSALMNRASTTLVFDNNENKYGKFQKEVIAAITKVEKLELRMAIVAPMKAGKSTIINAVVGQEILPSRNAAMTTLPTEIIFDAELKPPTLMLSEEILTVFQKTVEALRQKIGTLGTEQSQAKIAQYPHLNQLFQDIQQGRVGFTTDSKTTGRKEIIKALTGLNDIIRLCSLLEPTKDPLGQLRDVPCINTPYWQSQTTTQSEKLGNLVIVDTPGANEAGENLRLAAVVTEQLQRSSMVLIVLDFTQLKTEAAEKVKEEVQKVIELRGEDNLYVLINKVDQRREGDMNSEQLGKFVTAQLGLGNSDKNRVFEVSARRAFSAANFMQELEQNHNAEITEMQTARSLAQEALGTRWENKLKRATVDELSEEAQILWEESGFAPFLEDAINALMERAAPKCIKSALNLSRSCLEKLHEDILLRTSGIQKEANKLQHQVSLLEADLVALELCRNRPKQVDTIKLKLQDKLNTLLEGLKRNAKFDIEKSFRKEEYERANLVKKAEIGINKLLEILRNKEYKGSGLIEFQDDQEAENFINSVLVCTKQYIDYWLEYARQQATLEVSASCLNLLTVLQTQTEEIIERARTRLNEAFDVKLSPPPIPELQTVDFSTATPNKKTRERLEHSKKKYRPFYFLYLIERHN